MKKTPEDLLELAGTIRKKLEELPLEQRPRTFDIELEKGILTMDDKQAIESAFAQTPRKVRVMFDNSRWTSLLEVEMPSEE